MLLRRAFLLLLVAVAAAGTAAQEAALPRPPLDHLIIATHPDDETIGCARVMLQAIARRERVGIVVLTHGDAHVRLTNVAATKPEGQLTPEDFKAAGILRQHHVPAPLAFAGSSRPTPSIVPDAAEAPGTGLLARVQRQILPSRQEVVSGETKPSFSNSNCGLRDFPPARPTVCRYQGTIRARQFAQSQHRRRQAPQRSTRPLAPRFARASTRGPP